MRKSLPLSLRCIAVRCCHFHLSSEATELTELTALTIHPNAFWLLGWIALSSNSQPKSNVTITLLLRSPEITALSCWCSCIQYSGPWNTRFSAPRLFFVFSRSFLPSLSPFSISIKGHPSAKYGSTFSCYPNSTVSALRTREHWLEGRLQTTRSNAAHICLHQNYATVIHWMFNIQSESLVSSH